MLGAYYSKAVDSKCIFDNLKISNCENYSENLNCHNVITISFNEISEIGKTYKNRKFGEYFGFTEKEVIKLCKKK